MAGGQRRVEVAGRPHTRYAIKESRGRFKRKHPESKAGELSTTNGEGAVFRGVTVALADAHAPTRTIAVPRARHRWVVNGTASRLE